MPQRLREKVRYYQIGRYVNYNEQKWKVAGRQVIKTKNASRLRVYLCKVPVKKNSVITFVNVKL